MSTLRQTSLVTSPPDAGESAPPARKLLIVDDIADNRAVLTRRFQRQGFKIVEADCGPEALRLVDEQSFDCVLLDVMMPHMDGTEVLRQIRGKFSASLLPVIMVTAKSQPEDVIEALKFGANDYVTKPVDFSIALARVKSQIDRRYEFLETNESLLKTKTTLEHRVSERSFKLLQANTAMQEEISRRIASEGKLSYLARHDTLTGLANRFTFDENLKSAKQFARDLGSQLCLLLIDLDGFRNINDTFGHAVGDELLKEIGRRLTKLVGAKDFCARLGGDEFAIVHLSSDARSTAAALAEAIMATVCGGQVIDGNQIFVGANIGISVLCGGDNDTSALLQQADLAMDRAKADGSAVYRFFETEMGRQAEIRRSLELDLREAVANGDFQLFYQPIVNLKARKVTGVEALMRWNHATRGFVRPDEFIPLAEETGLIVPMGEWALRRACSDAAQWPNDIRVAVNLSAVQFRTASLVTTVAEALGESGLAPNRLELEITESIVLKENAQNLLTRLHELGVRISLDDFGAGYSGLGYFRSIPFDKVKIDQSFIRDMHSQPRSLAIVRAAIGLGKNLGICTTAEGVESLAQFERLLSEGCAEVQGFLFSKPQPNANLIKIINQIELMPDPAGFAVAGRPSSAVN